MAPPEVNDANLTATDIDASNGVIHVIDAVILPPEKTSATDPAGLIEHAMAEAQRRSKRASPKRATRFTPPRCTK